jgi:hypothetical protein
MADDIAIQLPQARLVARWWLVRPAQELARKHRHHARCCCWNHSYGVERQRGEGAQVQDARGMFVEHWVVHVRSTCDEA